MKRIAIILLFLSAPAFAGWSEPVRIGIPGGYQYPQILAAGDTLHVVGTLLPGGDKVVYLRSDNGGDSWSEGQVLSDTINSTNAMFARIVKHEQNLIVFWRSILNTGPRPWNIGYSLSHDNGETWTETLYIINPGWDHILYFSASGSGPVVNVIASRRVSPDLIFYSIRSTNFGESWLGPVEIFQGAQSSRTDQISHNNMVFYVWAGRFVWSGVYEIFYIRSFDNGETWSENFRLSDDDSVLSRTPAIFTNGGYTVGATWTDWKYTPGWLTGDIVYRQSSDSGSSWASESQITFNHLADYSDVCTSEDFVHVIWQDYGMGITRRSIYYERSSDGGESWGDPYWLDGTDDDSWNPAIAASNGKVYVVWADGRSSPPEDIYPGIYFSRYEEGTSVISEPTNLPQAISLSAYPNPFNTTTIISYANLDNSGGIDILNVLGQVVKTFNIQNRKGGQNGQGEIVWDGTDEAGNPVASGVYFAKARGSSGAVMLKLEYLK